MTWMTHIRKQPECCTGVNMVAPHLAIAMATALLAAGCALAHPSSPPPILPPAAVFTGPAVFERLSHFKDVGVPAVIAGKDLLNQAMIADGSCRLVENPPGTAPVGFDGYAFFFFASRKALDEG